MIWNALSPIRQWLPFRVRTAAECTRLWDNFAWVHLCTGEKCFVTVESSSLCSSYYDADVDKVVCSGAGEQLNDVVQWHCSIPTGKRFNFVFTVRHGTTWRDVCFDTGPARGQRLRIPGRSSQRCRSRRRFRPERVDLHEGKTRYVLTRFLPYSSWRCASSGASAVGLVFGVRCPPRVWGSLIQINFEFLCLPSLGVLIVVCQPFFIAFSSQRVQLMQCNWIVAVLVLCYVILSYSPLQILSAEIGQNRLIERTIAWSPLFLLSLLLFCFVIRCKHLRRKLRDHGFKRV